MTDTLSWTEEHTIGSQPETPRVSVVMRTKNCDWVVGQALAGLASQRFRDFELVVVDSGSTDRTIELLDQFPHRRFHIRPEDYFPGRVLNAAFEMARGDLLVCQNSDAVPLTPDTLSRLVDAFDDPAVQAAFSRQVVRPEADTWVRRDYATAFPERGDAPEWMTLSMPLAAVRRRAWQRHRFYTAAWGSEDTEWGQWARNNGLVVRYVPDALVMHSHNYTLRQLYGRRFIEGEADAFIYERDEGPAKLALRTVGSTLKDVVTCVRDGDFADIPRVPARRAVYHWAYLKGHRHGTRRRLERDDDASTGQRTVLDRHESNR